MKKPKRVKPFSFKDSTHQEVSDLLDQEYPVLLQYNEDLIDRIHQKYPYVTKTEVSIVVQAAFQTMRQLLVLGKVLNFNKVFFDTKLHFFGYRKNGKTSPSLKVDLSTPPPLREL